MGEVILLALQLFVVKEIQKGNGAVIVIFEEGKRGRLLNSHKDYDYYLRLAQRSLERKHPVGVSLAESDMIVEMMRADNDIAAELVEHDKERMKVCFQGHDGIFFLRQDHPHFKRVSKVINRSIKEKKRIWFVASKPTLVLVDVKLYESIEEK